MTVTQSPPQSQPPVELTPADLAKVRTDGSVHVKTILQIEAVECGAACLGMVLAHWGKWIPLEELRIETGVSRDGVSAIEVLHAARRFGLEAHGHRVDAAHLDGMSVPAIIWWRRNHFVVLEKAKNGKFRLNDPAFGRRVVDSEEFLECYSGAAITFKKTAEFNKSGRKFNVLPSLVRRLRHSKDGVWLIFLAGLLALLPALMLPVVSQIFVDEVLAENNAAAIPELIATLVVVAVVAVVLNQIQNAALVRLQTKLALVGSSKLLGHMLRMPLSFFWQRSVGDLSNRLSFPTEIAQVLAGQVAGAFISLFSVVAYSALMFYYDPQLAVIVLLLALANVLIVRAIIRRQVNTQMRLTRDLAEVQGITVRMTQSIETIKASGAESAAFGRWSAAQIKAINAQASMAGSSALLSAVPTFFAAITAAVILIVGGIGIINSTLSIGVLVAFQIMAQGISGPMDQISDMASEIQITTASVERIDDVIDQKPDTRFAHARPALAEGTKAKLAGHIELRNVTYGYRPTAPPLIKDFNLVIEPGQRVALVGVTGAGKSTVANLAAGLLEPWSGEVLYDGMPLSEVPVGVLERSLEKVDQTIVLFQASIRENITLWDKSIPEGDIRAALADAQVLSEVLRRPGGIDAQVLEGGRNFSGGQQQRLEIARSLVRNPTALILDESTSALDTVAEKAVDDALRARGCSCLIIAHRLSTIRDADLIVVLDRGGAELERGTHHELVARQGTYARLVAEAGEGGDVGN